MQTRDPSSADGATLRLGFGCGSLGSELDRTSSCKLLEAAYEAGFRHFDVAPSYGHGLAEGIVGEVLASVRKTVTIVTKAGIARPKAASGLRAVRKLFLPMKTAFPSLWGIAAGQANRAVTARGQFNREHILASVTESLRHLRIDQLDALLLHEVLPQDVNEELMGTLEMLRVQGAARELGTGTSVEASVEIVTQHPGLFDWIQTNHYWGAFLPELRTVAHRLVTHRSLRTGTPLVASSAFQTTLPSSEATRGLQVALADPQRGPALLLRAGLLQNAEGRLLVSTTRIERVRQFAEIARSPAGDALPGLLNSHLASLVHSTKVADT